ncbi:hypothetical protein [Flavobacterium sp. 245]|uniref:hypothetical protein n=1 Tax=Flavobacterium sp. 245 TaxID=2512115 RepID=UPI00105B86F0|nr:hypothetical protein [Flavobacterium sp. 245]TDP02453.1 hypothetical protein EV145_103443 [Flavobacterium sp. 245]
MRNIKSILTFILVLTFANIYAHKDRIEKPQSFKFTFENKEVVKLNSSDSKLKTFCNEIVSRKRKLVEAQMTYKTGEIVTAKYDGKNWTSIKISNKTEDLFVPKNVLKKITEIHFSTLSLLWSGDSEYAFNSSYFYIKFDIGRVKYFNELPSLSINFENKKYSNSEIWKKVSTNSTQGADL